MRARAKTSRIGATAVPPALIVGVMLFFRAAVIIDINRYYIMSLARKSLGFHVIAKVSLVLIHRLDPQFLHLLIQRVSIDAEEVGGFGFDAAAAGQGAVDQRVLDLPDE